MDEADQQGLGRFWQERLLQVREQGGGHSVSSLVPSEKGEKSRAVRGVGGAGSGHPTYIPRVLSELCLGHCISSGR